MDDLHIYLLDDGEQHWIAAATPGEALIVGREEYEVGGEDLGVIVRQLPDDEEIRISFPDDPPDPDDVPLGGRLDGDGIIATAAQWAAYFGAGVMVGTTVY